MNYSEEEKEAIKQLKKHKQEIDKQYISSRYSKAIEVVLNLIQKQESIIDKMAEQLTTPVHSKEWIIEFYKKEVEKDVKD